jgi:hypothetical protein
MGQGRYTRIVDRAGGGHMPYPGIGDKAALALSKYAFTKGWKDGSGVFSGATGPNCDIANHSDTEGLGGGRVTFAGVRWPGLCPPSGSGPPPYPYPYPYPCPRTLSQKRSGASVFLSLFHWSCPVTTTTLPPVGQGEPHECRTRC